MLYAAFSLPFCQRRSSFLAQTVSLTPPGASTNQIFDALLLDTLTGAISGFDCINARGQNAKEFLRYVWDFWRLYSFAASITCYEAYGKGAL